MGKNILIVVPHPDDDVLSFGGLISKEVRLGNNVYVHYFCVGGPCSNVKREIRYQELLEVSKFLNFIPSVEAESLDGLLDTLPNSKITSVLDHLIKTIEPEEVYCGAFSEHTDHQALYKAFLGTARLKSGFMPKLFAVGVYPFSDQLYSMPEGGKIFQPLCTEDWIKKCQAFKLYKSQFKESPSPLGLEGLRVRAEQDGLMCGSKYAEMYYQLRYIRNV